MKDIHIGSIIKQKVLKSPMSIQEFSDRIHRDRTTVYDIFKRKSVDTEILMKISEVLNFDFINEVYYKQKLKLQTAQKVFIVIEIDKDKLQKLDLPPDCIRFIKSFDADV